MGLLVHRCALPLLVLNACLTQERQKAEEALAQDLLSLVASAPTTLCRYRQGSLGVLCPMALMSRLHSSTCRRPPMHPLLASQKCLDVELMPCMKVYNASVQKDDGLSVAMTLLRMRCRTAAALAGA